MELGGRLSNLQLELLKLFQYNISDEQILEIRDLLAKYFARKATEEMDALWETNNWDEKTMEDWGKEHMRTKYDQ